MKQSSENSVQKVLLIVFLFKCDTELLMRELVLQQCYLRWLNNSVIALLDCHVILKSVMLRKN